MPFAFSRWKKWGFILSILLASLYAIPTLFGDDPAVQIVANEDTVEQHDKLLAEQSRVNTALKQQKLPVKSIDAEGNVLTVRFFDADTQLKAKPFLATLFPAPYSVALHLAPSTPIWLQWIGAKPMKLGLDLRGGVHFLMKVDLSLLIKRRLEGYQQELSKAFRQAGIYYQQSSLRTPLSNNQASPDSGALLYQFSEPRFREKAITIAKKIAPDLVPDFSENKTGESQDLAFGFSLISLQGLKNDAMEQTITTLRNRINELGVSESVVQRQGAEHIVVELPGIQDTAYAKKILGKTATLEFLMHDEENEATLRKTPGPVPIGSKWVTYRGGKPVLLKKQTVLTGDAIIGASTGNDNRMDTPAVNIRLGGPQVARFSDITQKNIGRRMAVLYIETKDNRTTETVISLATIQSALGSQFQITGLTQSESRDLALLLRSGALPAPVDFVEERIVGPSMGQENIQMGMLSVTVGLALVLGFMTLYYRGFGLIANIALVANLVLLLAIMSIIGATLTLPGIAGIVLTLGMAVDANVLIFERIREELRLGVPPLSSIQKGFHGAFNTIIDSNLTTLIAGLVLFFIGSGPVKGFAVTLCIGILTSLYTAVTGSQLILSFVFNKPKPIKKLSIGI
ncbi:MAG: protein translocase subunit SecD [Pseudomonadota bacterium]|jgi:preprotein translocase subunit SecD